MRWVKNEDAVGKRSANAREWDRQHMLFVPRRNRMCLGGMKVKRKAEEEKKGEDEGGRTFWG